MSKLFDAALDPSCLMCLTPGGWYSPLRQGVIWPGSPRNFAAEPATWYDAYLAWVGLTDYEWTIKFTPHSSDNATIIGTGTSSGLRIYTSGGKLYTMLGLDYTTAPPTVVINEEVTVTVSYVDGVKTSIINGQTMATIGAIAAPVPASLTSSFGGTIREITLKDHATGRVVWSYPSESERLRLITNTNVLNTGTHWEAANPAVAARIDSQIDLRGRVSSYTVIVDFEAASFGGLATQKQELAGQGPSIASGGTYPICSLAYGANPGGVLQISQEIGGLRVPMTRNIPILSGRHVAAATVEVNQIANNTTLSVYLDGARVLTPGVYAGIPTGIATQPNFAIGDNRSGAFTNQIGKIYAAALFDEALSAGQIAYLSN